MSASNDFLPADYEVPSNSNYLKFKDGETRFRILSKPVVGWEDWKDKKPVRFRFDSKPQKSFDPEKPVKHFWAMVVWDYQGSRMAILEITQVGIQKTIKGLAKDPDWGDPSGYDIKVVRSGSGFDTEYTVAPVPHKPVATEILEQYQNASINLDALFDGKDPFAPF